MLKKRCKTSCLRCLHRCRHFYYRAAALCFIPIALVGLSHFCLKQTDNFSLTSITSKRPFDPAWQMRAPTLEEENALHVALSQKYHYFSRGGQCFVFVSEDGQYVLKLLKEKNYTIPLWHYCIPNSFLFEHYKERKCWQRQDKLARDFLSYKIAYEELPEMTGTLFVHLNPTGNLQRHLTIVDRLHIEHSLDLDKIDFVLQRRAQLISPTIADLVHAGNLEEAKNILDQIAQLVVTRCRHGLEDRDPEVRTNCGVIDGRVIKIDIGRFARDYTMRSREQCLLELKKVLGPFKDWLEPVHSSLGDYCDEAALKALAQEFGA